jgi:hypothetical protein
VLTAERLMRRLGYSGPLGERTPARTGVALLDAEIRRTASGRRAVSIYFVEAVGLGLVKIGFAIYPKHRMSKLRADSPVPVVLRAVIEGDQETERQLQSRFADYKRNGEWFENSGSLAQFLSSLPEWQPPGRKRRQHPDDSGVAHLIDELGGPKLMAELLGTTPQVVCNWRTRERIPGWAQHQLAYECARRGIPIASDILAPRRPGARRQNAMGAEA